MDWCWDILLNRVSIAIDRMCPLKTFKFAREKPLWLTNEIIELMKDRDYAATKAAHSKKDEDLLAARRLRNTTNAIVRSAKEEYTKEQLERHKSNPNKF